MSITLEQQLKIRRFGDGLWRLSDKPSRITRHNNGWRHSSRDHTTSTNNRPFSHSHAKQQESSSANEGIGSNRDGSGLKRPVGLAKIVGTGAEVSLLSHSGSGMNHHWAQAIDMGTIAKARPVMEGEVPGVLNASPLVNERPTTDRDAEAAQDKQAPRITRLWRPLAEQGPGGFPKQHPQSVAQTPGTR